MTSTLRAPRSRGALSGLLLILLGLWGGLVPFVGPYQHFAYSPDRTWQFTSGRLWLEVLPAVGAILGGLIVLTGANRMITITGAWLASLAGAWFVVGGPISTLWTASGHNEAGAPIGDSTRQVVEGLAFFTGLGVLIVFFAALALGRFTVIGRKEAQLAAPPAEEPTPAHKPITVPPPVHDTPGPPQADPPRHTTAEYPRTQEPVRGRYARPSEPDPAPTPSSDPADQWVAGSKRKP